MIAGLHDVHLVTRGHPGASENCSSFAWKDGRMQTMFMGVGEHVHVESGYRILSSLSLLLTAFQSSVLRTFSVNDELK